jgi:cyclophilin family peptidyl-prolyl cis-trans isomerase
MLGLMNGSTKNTTGKGDPMRFLFVTILVALCAILGPTSLQAEDSAASMKPTYVIKTAKGEITLELDAEKAPGTVLNFDYYVSAGFYNGTIFHRVIPNFMIQGGGFLPDETQKSEGLREPIANEWRNGLKNVRGSIAMARIGRRPDSATAQFFINLKDNPVLDKPNDGAAYCVFGTVTAGIETVDAIAAVPTVAKASFGGREKANPVEPILIETITAVTPLDRDKATARKTVAAEEIANAEKIAKEAAQKAAMAEVEDFVAAKEKELGAKREVTDSGLISIVMQAGTGTVKPTVKDKAKVHYTGTFLDGKEFDSSRKPGRQPFDVNLAGGVIQGWLEGLKLMTEGERRLFIIPPDLAYGPGGSPGAIPPNSWLVFDVEMLKIN